MPFYFKRGKHGQGLEPIEYLYLDDVAGAKIANLATHQNARIKQAFENFTKAQLAFQKINSVELAEMSDEEIRLAHEQIQTIERHFPRDNARKKKNCLNTIPMYLDMICCHPRASLYSIQVARNKQNNERLKANAVQEYLQKEQALIRAIEEHEPAFFEDLKSEALQGQASNPSKSSCIFRFCI